VTGVGWERYRVKEAVEGESDRTELPQWCQQHMMQAVVAATHTH
jgi:hypothetical protein